MLDALPIAICIFEVPLPDFAGLLRQRVLYQSLKFGFLGVSAGNVCGQLGPDIMVYGGGLTAVQALRMGVGIVAGAENGWIGLLTWFPTRVSLENVLLHCLDSLVELTRWLGLCTVFSSKWGYELTSLSQQDSRMGSRASTALFGDLTSPECAQDSLVR